MEKLTISSILKKVSDTFKTPIQGVVFRPTLLHSFIYVCGLKKRFSKFDYLVQIGSFPKMNELKISNAEDLMWVAEGCLDQFLLGDTLIMAMYKLEKLEVMYMLDISYKVDGNSSEIQETILYEDRRDAETDVLRIREKSQSIKATITEVKISDEGYVTEEEMLRDFTT